MERTNKYKGKKIVVLGLARSGRSAAHLLHQLEAEVIVNDAKDLKEDVAAQRLIEMGIKVISGNHPLDLMDETIDMMVKNPGVPYGNPMVKKAMEKNIPVVTDVELAYEVCEGKVVGITGTNGKTTTTALLTEMMNTGRTTGKAHAAGNIGLPASEVVMNTSKEDEIIIELSSFQLLGTKEFRPTIAILTNVFSAHLDYHGTRDEYVSAKMNITKNQKETDWFIYNWDQPELRQLAGESKAQLIPFSRKEPVENGAYLKGGTIYFQAEPVMKRSDIALPGNHNLENTLAAVAAAKIMGQSNEHIKTCLRQFSGVKHRMQFVLEFENRKVYNDSKATNSLATIQALQGFEQPVILLAGGLDRGVTFDDLVPHLQKHVKAMIVFGETAELLAEAGKKAGIKQIHKTEDVAAAVPVAFRLSEEEDVILLSPACASWDQFDTFEERGDAFIQSVDRLIQNQKGGLG